jgi:hypothetical protein
LSFIFIAFLIISLRNINLVISAICLFASIYACMSMGPNIPMPKIHLDIGLRMFFTCQEITMIV